MDMMWLPFACLTAGLIVGLQRLPKTAIRVVDLITTISLVGLMLTIGGNIGTNETMIANLGRIGFNCAVIALFAIAFSILLVVILEKTILPLEEVSRKLSIEKLNVNVEVDIAKEEQKKSSSLIFLMPISIITGILIGRFVLPADLVFVLGYSLTASLVILYISVGISLGSNHTVFKYVRMLGWKIVLISVAIIIGSLTGGILSGLLLHLPPFLSILSASGMSYYSITGAFMTQAYGIEAGTYGFMVNVMREFITVLLLPLLVRISKGSPIAGGAAGDMDTMLVPITKFVGPELGLVTLITGTILTFAVPVVLPLLYNLFPS
jgi:uncharacterized membrane protein YbjE (DUF340 family)